MTRYGPNDQAVQQLIARARHVSAEDGHAILDARMDFVGVRAADDAERAALRRVQTAARRSRRLEAYNEARHAVATALREARHGEVGPWLSVSATIANAAGAVVVQDLLDLEDFELLYRPWRLATQRSGLVPTGPGRTPFGVPQRRRTGTLIGG
jgi:hypothetical protein